MAQIKAVWTGPDYSNCGGSFAAVAGSIPAEIKKIFSSVCCVLGS